VSAAASAVDQFAIQVLELGRYLGLFDGRKILVVEVFDPAVLDVKASRMSGQGISSTTSSGPRCG